MQKPSFIPLASDVLDTGAQIVLTAVGDLDKTLQVLQRRLDGIFSGVTLAQYMFEATAATGKLDKELLVMRLALGKLRIAIGDAFAPIGQMVLPVINDAIFATTRFVRSAGKIIRALFGIKDGTDDAAEAEEGYSQAVSAAASTVKRSLASFDRLNRLQQNSGGGGGSSTAKNSRPQNYELDLEEFLVFNTISNMLAPLKEIDLSPLVNSLKNLYAAMAPINQKLFEGLRWAWDEIFVPIIQWSAEILLPEILATMTVALEALNAVIETCKPALSYLWEGFLQPIAQWAGQYLLEQLDQLQFKLTSVENWANTFPISAQQVLLWINDFAGGIIPTTELLALFNLTQDAASGKTNKFGYELWALTSPFSKLGGALEDLSIDLADLTGGWDKTGAAGIAAHEKLTGMWGGLGEWFRTNVWDPMESGFQSTGNGILGTFGGVSSGATSAMNGMIKGINQVKFTIPSWVPLLGGKSYGFNIPLLQAPQIPKLATGAVLPANKPFLAVVGDQRHGTNVEAPLTTIQEAVRLELQDLVDSNLAGQEAVTGVLRQILEAVLGISISDSQIALAADRYQSKMAVVHGNLY